MSQNAQIGPHEGIEFEIIQNDLKHVALFTADLPLSQDFLDALANKIYQKLDVELVSSNGQFRFLSYIIYRESHAYFAQKLAKILKQYLLQGGFNPDYDREIGTILGYTTEDIEFYIQRFQSKPR